MKRTVLAKSTLALSVALGISMTVLAVAANYLVYNWQFAGVFSSRNVLRFHGGQDNWAGRKETIASDFASPNLHGIIVDVIRRIDAVFSYAMLFEQEDDGDEPKSPEQVALVAIDMESVVRAGTWPWPRNDVALLIDKLADARVVGLDFLLIQPDRTSLRNVIGTLGIDASSWDPEFLDNDLRLARAISRAKSVLGVRIYQNSFPPYTNRRPLSNYQVEITRPDENEAFAGDVFLRRLPCVITSTGKLRDSRTTLAGEGFIDLFSGQTGVIHSAPLFAQVANYGEVGPHWLFVPSFVLEMARVALGGNRYRLGLYQETVNLSDITGEREAGEFSILRDVTIVDDSLPAGKGDLLRIPLNRLGDMEFAFSSRRRAFKTYPAWEVLSGMHDGEFKDKLVIIGPTYDAAASHIFSYGIAEEETSLPAGHAGMLSTIIRGRFRESTLGASYSWQQAAILVAGLAATAAMVVGSLAVCLIVPVFSLFAALFSGYFLFFRHGVEAGMAMPFLSILFFAAVQLVSSYRRIGQERRFIREAFSLNVSPSILGYLENHPDRISSLQGESRDMSVIFTDIRGFTAISEKMRALELARFLNEYFTPMSEIIIGHMGTVDKFIGDGLMAFWNAPADNPNHARDAALAALGMIERLKDLQADWTWRGLPEIAIGCGINSGTMFAGYMGSAQRKNYTVMGDNVNIASRLENLNKVYSSTILISEATRAAIGNDFVCRVTDKVRVSGKQSSILIYELLRHGEATEEEREELAAFSRVFDLYLMREFDAAESLLNELTFIRQAPIYRLFLDRLAVYKAMPPPPDWDGTFFARHK